MRAGGARCAVPAAASDPAAAPVGSGRLLHAAGATLSAPRRPSAGDPDTPSAVPGPALSIHSSRSLDMEGAAAPAARDGPDLGPGAPGSPPEAVAGATAAPAAAAPEPRKPHGVKRHHHKHNLKHRYELQETLGKGTYGKVKRATERFSGRVVSAGTPRGRGGGGGLWGPRAPGAGALGAEPLWSERGLSGNPQTAPLSPPAPRDSGVFLS